MKKVEAIIRHFKLVDVATALVDAGAPGLTASEVMGQGRECNQIEIYHPRDVKGDLLPKNSIFVVVPDDRVDEIISIIMKAAFTGKPGDGKIFVYGVDEAYTIRTGENNT